MNWGKGIIIGMGIFMLFIVAMVISMFNQPVDDYDKQYYEKGLAYDSTYNKEKQVLTDNAKPVLSIAGDELIVVFTGPAKVQLHFSRPSDRKMDVVFSQETNSHNSIHIPLGGMATGQWQVAIDWQSNKKQYLYKQEITIR